MKTPVVYDKSSTKPQNHQYQLIQTAYKLPVRTQQSSNYYLRQPQNLCYSWLVSLTVLFLVMTSESSYTFATSSHLNCTSRQIKAMQFEDAGARAFISQVVFKGIVKARTAVDSHGFYEASFLMQQPIKGFQQVRKKKRRRIQFVMPPPRQSSPGSGTGATAGCRRGVVAANVELDTPYLVFADRAGQHQLRAIASPMLDTKRHQNSINKTLCHNCLTPPRVHELRNATVRLRQRLKLSCRYVGNPLPTIEWYHHGRRVLPSKRIRIYSNKRRRSFLVIPRVTLSDAGKYECRAVSVLNEIASLSADVSVDSSTPPPSKSDPTPVRQNNASTLWPFLDSPCPLTSYCLNGGTCLYYEAVGELVCECAEGYKGQRCENKDVYNRGSMYRPRPFSCKLGYSSSFYC